MLFRVIKIILISFAVRFHSVTDRFPHCSFQERFSRFFQLALLGMISACFGSFDGNELLLSAGGRVGNASTCLFSRPILRYKLNRNFEKFREHHYISCDLYSTWSFFFFFSFQFILYFLIQGRGGSHMYYIYRNKILVVTIYDRISIVHFISKNNHYCFSIILFFFFLWQDFVNRFRFLRDEQERSVTIQ